MWCLTGLENGKQVVKRTGVVGHKSLRTKRLVVESLSDIETSIFKVLLTYHFLISIRVVWGDNKSCKILHSELSIAKVWLFY